MCVFVFFEQSKEAQSVLFFFSCSNRLFLKIQKELCLHLIPSKPACHFITLSSVFFVCMFVCLCGIHVCMYLVDLSEVITELPRFVCEIFESEISSPHQHYCGRKNTLSNLTEPYIATIISSCLQKLL